MRPNKITSAHVQRHAYIYVRQSTEHQVRCNLESQQRQYELSDLARSYGWEPEAVMVIDDDLGRSASSTTGRTGFARLVSDVALGRVGIVLSLEVSRLARNNMDWYQLLDLCSLRGTLIGDSDAVYDPAEFNDRLLLGLKGTMSEAELHVLKSRMLAGLRHKAERGKLKFHLPPGYEFHDETCEMSQSTDERVRHMIELVFSKFFEKRSVSGLVRYLLDEGLLFPRKAAYDLNVRWVRPYYKAVHSMLLNPLYAGTYVFGRSKVIVDVDEQGQRRTRRQSQMMKDWGVVIHDHHPSYISWDDHLRIRKMIESNRPAPREQASGAAREGSGLLQGLVRCGRCGRSMQMRYAGNGKGTGGRSFPRYVCSAAYRMFGGELCQSVGGRRIDEDVAQLFLHEMSTAELDLHLGALRKLRSRRDEVLTQLELELERARFEAERYERQYHAIEPENRLVARTVEKQWNDALVHVEELEGRVEERRRERALHLSKGEEVHLKRLAADLPQLWSSPPVTNKDRKKLLRSVIEEVQIIKEDRTAHLKVVWKGGATTDRVVHLPKTPRPSDASLDLVDLIRRLATRHTDEQIARVLIRKRLKTPKGLPFSAHRVASLRLGHGIECYRQSNDRGIATYTPNQAATMFGVSIHTIYFWIKNDILKGDQITAGAPWSVYITDEDRSRLSKQESPEGWLSVVQAADHCGVTKQTMLNWVKAGKVSYVYVSQGRRRGLRIDVNTVACPVQPSLIPVST